MAFDLDSRPKLISLRIDGTLQTQRVKAGPAAVAGKDGHPTVLVRDTDVFTLGQPVDYGTAKELADALPPLPPLNVRAGTIVHFNDWPHPVRHDATLGELAQTQIQAIQENARDRAAHEEGYRASRMTVTHVAFLGFSIAIMLIVVGLLFIVAKGQGYI